ncbi:NAD(P)H-hydrate dehydratase [Aminobacter anthyllidis]|uniref:Bifunctional NAD(P)H-hydrate repair enzyme n=1 Tax=Aminobacter anthyllidis TaxID=1035067 RepID=A0A9X1D4C7_9HYPH|nr:NAD(P)H-hydrate dehydratase [Aminobacter anthyllidis]MBT1154786.1 NAD(P)H-hydrate dehydratase [Aminobacter anthyllidis]
MAFELLTPGEMAEADRLTIAVGPVDGIGLMRRAGGAIADLVLARYPGARTVHVLCGPGNNGGDGYVVARLLAENGVAVGLFATGAPREGSDAALAAAECPVAAAPLAAFAPEAGSIVIDALFGAGLSKPLGSEIVQAIARTAAVGVPVIAVDLPSGVSGVSGDILGSAFQATLTVTFARKKPGHLLFPGRALCGEIVVVDIGITDATIAATGARCFENDPAWWRPHFPSPANDAHKYSRGHVGVFSGGPSATGAARLSAMAAARAGAGAVTVLSPGAALAANAAHLTSIILRRSDTLQDTLAFLGARKPEVLVYGPGLGPEPEVGRFALELMSVADGRFGALVLDADGITSLSHRRAAFFEARKRPNAPALVLTPHHGEFGRLFPEIAADASLSKLEQARAAARRAHAIVIYKGPDTVIAAPDGRAAVNTNGTPLLATAGSGDVLSGIVAALLAQRMPAFEAACAAVWMHAEAARRFGPGLIAEDLPLALREVVAELGR